MCHLLQNCCDIRIMDESKQCTFFKTFIKRAHWVACILLSYKLRYITGQRSCVSFTAVHRPGVARQFQISQANRTFARPPLSGMR